MASKKKPQPCPECNGSGIVPWGTTLLTCAACNGTGDVQKSSAKDRG